MALRATPEDENFRRPTGGACAWPGSGGGYLERRAL